MIRSAASVLLRSTALTALICTLFAGSAHAAPAWLFNGVEFNGGQEGVVGDAVLGTFTTAFGLSVVCKKTHYEMTISNKAKVGQASLNQLLFSTCTATSPCTVEAIEAEAFPWPSNLALKSSEPYFIVNNVNIQILFGGASCALYETWMQITGTAGARYDNPTESFAFSTATAAATGTKLVAFGEKVDWTAAFTTEAEFHKGETLTVG